MEYLQMLIDVANDWLRKFFIWFKPIQNDDRKLLLFSTIFVFSCIAVYLLFFSFIKGIKRRGLASTAARKVDRMTGEEFEKYLKARYELKGYRVTLTPKSGDYGADLICRKGGERLAVQAKRYKGKVGVAAVQQAAAAKDYYRCNKAAVATNSYYTAAAKKLAGRIGVQLIDRKSLDLI
jgi:restriction system protein